MRDVVALTRQVIALLYDALDYRGQQALGVQAVADSRTTLRPVYSAITPDDLWRILEDAGYKCGDIEDDDVDAASFSVRRYGIRAVGTLISPAPDDIGFKVIALGLAAGAEMRVLWLAGGVTASWLEHQFADWFNDQRKQTRQVKKQPQKLRPKTSRSVH